LGIGWRLSDVFIVNLRTVHALGLAISESILERADEVIR